VFRGAGVAPGGVPAHDWRSIWMVAAICSGVVLVMFLGEFSDKKVGT
jgi:hypothetical protein